jgi:acetyl-CoA carboxylase biotin carboxyl carrier protein
MTDSASDEAKTSGDEFGLNAVRELLQLIRETDVTELKIERGDIKLHIKRGAAPATPFVVTPSLAESLGALAHRPAGTLVPQPTAPNSPPGATEGARAADGYASPNGQTITAPMVGTYYSAPSPRDPPFVNEGDEIRTGDVIGIVEAMKIMNEIESEFAGRVVRILVATGQPVEYGQPLMIVEPI